MPALLSCETVLIRRNFARQGKTSEVNEAVVTSQNLLIRGISQNKLDARVAFLRDYAD